jgi:hypothetical protein
MSEDSRFDGHPGTPAGGKAARQDYGFFTSAPAAAPTQFAGPPASATAPPPGQALPQAAHDQFGPPPAARPAPPVAHGSPPVYGQPPYPPAPRGGLPVWAIVAICVPAALVVLGILAAIAIPVFLNQRSTPVMPDSIRGVSRSTDPAMTDTAAHSRDQLRRANPGAKIDAAVYGTSRSGYVLIGANLRMNPSQEFGTLGATDAPMYFGTTQCATAAQSHVSLCVHIGTRGSVELLALGGSNLSQLATDTAKAWSAQPFGN